MANSSVLSAAGRVGGYARAALHDGREMTAAARARFIASFEEGHVCKVCPETTLPAELLPVERQRRGEALRRAHYARLALARVRSRAAATADPARKEVADRPVDRPSRA